MTETEIEALLSDCTLCPRKCHADRTHGKNGYCGMSSIICAARAALHMWEEPCISGEKGSGTVFFTGCGLRCCFCQNREIAVGNRGKVITVDRLADIFMELKKKGAANINLVTGAHYVPQIIAALEIAVSQGMDLPVIYNSSGYEAIDTLRMLEGYVDIYLPDFKYMDRHLASQYSNAGDYPETAKEAIDEMVRQTGDCTFDEKGYIRKGTIVRHLILPGHTKNSIQVLEYLWQTYGDKIFISIMNQYTPIYTHQKYAELNRVVTKREYEKVLNYAVGLGIKNGFIQEGKTAEESFIPAFDDEGI